MSEDFFSPYKPSGERTKKKDSQSQSGDTSSIPLVLVADDNEPFLRYVKRVVESNGYECVTTDSPGTAVRIALEKHPAVVLCDINFGIGRTSGTDVFAEIRRVDAHVPFVIVSAFIQQEAKDRAAKLGITHYVTKPVEPEQLIAEIRNVIGSQRITP
ncbi:MAG: response regulator [Bacteriovoracaceae bacterium]|nr:response regulator [Bacteroidota bacterium]